MSNHIELNNLEIYKEIVDHMSEWLWIWNQDYNTVYVNDIFCQFTWYEQEDIIWDAYTKFIGSVESLKELSAENSKIKYETILQTNSWDNIPVLCSGKLTKNGWIVLIISDLRELKTLKQINKTKDEFISIVWHELRTPLTSIRWYLSMLLEWDLWDISESQKKALNHSYNSSVRLIQLVNDVLSIWKIESWKMEYYFSDIKVVSFLNSVYNDIYMEAENNGLTINLEYNEDIEEIVISSDKDKLKQVLLNLLTNAIKFTEKGGTITLRASKIESKIRFEVIDTGVWIPQDKLEILFEKFSQVEWAMQRHNTSWLGLGLSICKNFLRKLESEIHIESEVEKWSNFYFDLDIKS